MTAVCPRGHTSLTSDYCDQCGDPIASARTIEPEPHVEDADTSAAARYRPCSICGAARSGDDRFCENCGHDFAAGGAAASGWEAVVSADREQFARFTLPGVEFPERYGERRFDLDAARIRIGCWRGAPGNERPEIDLAVPPVDPGISRLHALLERQDDGSYAIRDLGSTNGTSLDDGERPVGTDAALRLVDGDRIHVGVWTTIVIRSRAASEGRR